MALIVVQYLCYNSRNKKHNWGLCHKQQLLQYVLYPAMRNRLEIENAKRNNTHRSQRLHSAPHSAPHSVPHSSCTVCLAAAAKCAAQHLLRAEVVEDDGPRRCHVRVVKLGKLGLHSEELVDLAKVFQHGCTQYNKRWNPLYE